MSTEPSKVSTLANPSGTPFLKVPVTLLHKCNRFNEQVYNDNSLSRYVIPCLISCGKFSIPAMATVSTQTPSSSLAEDAILPRTNLPAPSNYEKVAVRLCSLRKVCQRLREIKVAHSVVDDLPSPEGEGDGLGGLSVVPASPRPQHRREALARVLKYFA